MLRSGPLGGEAKRTLKKLRRGDVRESAQENQQRDPILVLTGVTFCFQKNWVQILPPQLSSLDGLVLRSSLTSLCLSFSSVKWGYLNILRRVVVKKTRSLCGMLSRALTRIKHSGL